jgi:hypothetical protein
MSAVTRWAVGREVLNPGDNSCVLCATSRDEPRRYTSKMSVLFSGHCTHPLYFGVDHFLLGTIDGPGRSATFGDSNPDQQLDGLTRMNTRSRER